MTVSYIRRFMHDYQSAWCTGTFHQRPRIGRGRIIGAYAAANTSQNLCAVNYYMTYLLRLPPSHPRGHSLPSSGLKTFPQEIRLDTMQRLHLSSPAGDELANEKTRQAAAMLTSHELQLLRRPLTKPPRRKSPRCRPP